jgi:tRNA (guanine-N7-)-methyltransferase
MGEDRHRRADQSRPLTLQGSGAFFGRRKGKALRAGQKDLFGTLLPRLRVDLASDLTAQALFATPVRAMWLEIGFGGGEHLLKEARANPDIGFIGCEPFVNGMAKLLAAIERENLHNIRLYDADALDLLKHLPVAACERVYLLYPDPWPKRRQRKRRFVSDETVSLIARSLKPGGQFRFASDIDHYVGWTLAHLVRSSLFRWTAERADDWRLPWAGWESTRYEQKARREGRKSSYLTFERV